MKRKLLFLVLLLSPALAPASETTDGEDFAIYLQSTGGPVAVEKCTPVLPDPKSIKLAYDEWWGRNKARAQHGRQLALTKRSEAELRAWEASNLKDYRERVDAMDATKKLQFCTGVLNIFQAKSFK